MMYVGCGRCDLPEKGRSYHGLVMGGRKLCHGEEMIAWRKVQVHFRLQSLCVMADGLWRSPDQNGQTEQTMMMINNVSLATQPRLSVGDPSDRKRLR